MIEDWNSRGAACTAFEPRHADGEATPVQAPAAPLPVLLVPAPLEPTDHVRRQPAGALLETMRRTTLRGTAPCPSAMPNPPTAAIEGRRGGDPKHPHRGREAIQHLPRPSVVPAPGVPAHCRIARGERAGAESGVPGSPRPARYARGHRHGSKTLSRDRPNCSEAPSQPISGQIPVPKMRREMPHYVQTNKNSPFVQYPG